MVKKWDMKIEEATDQCMMQHAQSVGKHAKCLSNRLKEGQFIAEIAINQNLDSETNQ